MVLDVKQIKKRYKKAETHKDQWRSIYEEAYEYALPMRNLYDGYYEGNVPGQNKMKRVFDSTAIHSTARFANRIQSSLFPPQNRRSPFQLNFSRSQDQSKKTVRIRYFLRHRADSRKMPQTRHSLVGLKSQNADMWDFATEEIQDLPDADGT